MDQFQNKTDKKLKYSISEEERVSEGIWFEQLKPVVAIRPSHIYEDP